MATVRPVINPDTFTVEPQATNHTKKLGANKIALIALGIILVIPAIVYLVYQAFKSRQIKPLDHQKTQEGNLCEMSAEKTVSVTDRQRLAYIINSSGCNKPYSEFCHLQKEKEVVAEKPIQEIDDPESYDTCFRAIQNHLKDQRSEMPVWFDIIDEIDILEYITPKYLQEEKDDENFDVVREAIDKALRLGESVLITRADKTYAIIRDNYSYIFINPFRSDVSFATNYHSIEDVLIHNPEILYKTKKERDVDYDATSLNFMRFTTVRLLTQSIPYVF